MKKASSALALLSQAEQAAVLRYYHVADAKLALGSVLLKRLAISRLCSVAWSAAVPVRDARTKPVYLDGEGREPLVFNVSHQAGLVVLLGLHGENLGGSSSSGSGNSGAGNSGSGNGSGAAVGIDLVCPVERRARDHDSIAKQGWTHFVDMHADVFSPKDTAALRDLASLGDGGGVDGRDSALRHFYALWCLREAYVKMTGDALLASWLAQLEMPGFAPPGTEERDGAGEGAASAHRQEIWVGGRRVQDVSLVLRPLLGEYMVATAVRLPGGAGDDVELGEFESVDMDEVVAYGEAAVVAVEQ